MLLGGRAERDQDDALRLQPLLGHRPGQVTQLHAGHHGLGRLGVRAAGRARRRLPLTLANETRKSNPKSARRTVLA